MEIEKNPSSNEEDASFSIERQLKKRLKGMGYLFFGLSSAALLFAFFVPANPQTPEKVFVLDENSILADIERLAGKTLFTDMQPLELAPQDVLNFYYISLLFGSIGVMFVNLSRTSK